MAETDDIVRDLHRHAFDDCDGVPPLTHIAVQAADTILSLKSEIEALRDALVKCRDKFSFYEQMHSLKCTSEGDEKADRNREMADMCSAALAGSGPKQ